VTNCSHHGLSTGSPAFKALKPFEVTSVYPRVGSPKSSSTSKMASSDPLKALAAAIDDTVLIDNHCHNLLKLDHISKSSLLSIASEAQGDEVLGASRTSLAHIRATKYLAQVLGCEHSWDAVEAAVNEQRSRDPTAWTKKCLEGFETLLLDDGFGDSDAIEHYSWHDGLVRSKCKRIVRIETVASGLFADTLATRGSKSPEVLLDEFVAAFESEIAKSMADSDVVGFKSVICYRGGLDIPRDADATYDKAKKAFPSLIELYDRNMNPFKHPYQLPLNQTIVHLTAKRISQSSTKHKKVFQFHTGLGDNDLTLTKSSPAHLQPFIGQYATVPIVLLHSSYPWTREAGYLATMYPNVYADIGEVFPFLSQGGQEGIIRQILELTPWSKVLMSTDGNSQPEMYLITLRQIRSVLKTVSSPRKMTKPL
jgi:hypothetical protein